MLCQFSRSLLSAFANRDTFSRQSRYRFKPFAFAHAGQRAETFQMRRRQVDDQRRFRARQANGRAFRHGD